MGATRTKPDENIWPKGEWQLWNKPAQEAAVRTASASDRALGDYLSYEPYAITLRRDDAAFANLVRSSFERMASKGTLSRLYTRWLVDPLPNGDTLNVPMSPHLAEIYRPLGQPD